MLRELRVSDMRYRAVLEVLDGAVISTVARRHGVSRQTVHAWLRRYAREGAVLNLEDRSSRPHGVSASDGAGAGGAGIGVAGCQPALGSDPLDGIDGARLLVHGKGGRTRVMPISDSLAAEIRAGAAGHTIGAPSDGWLFPERWSGRHITAQYVGQLVTDALPDHWTMHSLRHRFASRAYRGTRNLGAAQVLVGHASIATTERYLAVDDGEIRAAMIAAISD